MRRRIGQDTTHSGYDDSLTSLTSASPMLPQTGLSDGPDHLASGVRVDERVLTAEGKVDAVGR